MLNTSVHEITIEVPMKLFNNNPLQSIYSVLTRNCKVLGYVVNNLLTHDHNVVVKVYYNGYNVDQLYFISSEELSKYKVNENHYVINNVNIKVNKLYKVNPLKLIPARTGYINIPLTNINRVLDTFNSLSTLGRFNKTYGSLLWECSGDYNKLTYEPPEIAIKDDLTNTLSISFKNYSVSLTKNINESLEDCNRFKRSKNSFCGALEKISLFTYAASPLDIKDELNVSTAYFFYMTDEFIKYFKNTSEGLLITFRERKNPLLCLYIPYDNYLMNFTGFYDRFLNDLVNYCNVRWCLEGCLN